MYKKNDRGEGSLWDREKVLMRVKQRTRVDGGLCRAAVKGDSAKPLRETD